MCAALGYKVTGLKRVRIMNISVKGPGARKMAESFIRRNRRNQWNDIEQQQKRNGNCLNT
jgi:16S rRNA U516 pseudouridylate synthase RsuA-like enzyme